MKREITEFLMPRILVLDDERQIHASLRLRLSVGYELTFCLTAKEALEAISASQFDLCFVDIHMPQMNGLDFIEAAQLKDAALGHVVLSAFDSPENLRRALPLQVFDFVTKPFPERHQFESKIPEWVNRTRHQRSEQRLARDAGQITRYLDAARQEREVEFVASETARDALLQTANLLTTINAHLTAALASAGAKTKIDSSGAALLKNVEIAKKTAEAATAVTEGFFNSSYGSRDSSPALLDSGVKSAIQIAMRIASADAANKTTDFTPYDGELVVRMLSGIEFLLMMVPAIAIALRVAKADTTVGIQIGSVDRLDVALKTPRLVSDLWVNRKHALLSYAGIIIRITASSPPLSRSALEAWLRAEEGELAAISSRGLVAGLKKCQGLLSFSLAPNADRFHLALVLPT